jgi:hypothetical protein
MLASVPGGRMFIDLPFASKMRIDTHRNTSGYATKESCEEWHHFDQWIGSVAKREQVQAPQGECE